MKYLIAVLSGFTVTLGIFFGGMLFAVTYLSAEPVRVETPRLDTAAAPAVVRKVDISLREHERSQARKGTISGGRIAAAGTDDMTTSALPAAPSSLSREHIAWCERRYRSYRPETDSYTTYSGESRPCRSPYPAGDEAGAIEVSTLSGPATERQASLDHVAACFARYRSYRPQDNTYQPYGGGPRRQCQ